MQKIEYKIITSPAELDILSVQSASYGTLTFDFPPEYINKLKERLTEPHAVQILATDTDKFVGYIAGSETIFPSYLFLSELFVSPDFAGKGIATELVQRTTEFAKNEGLKGVMVETEHENIPAQKLYEKIGFERIDNPEWNGVTYRLCFQ